MARFGNSNGLSVKSSFLEPKCGQKSQIWPPCDQIALANWIIYMNLHFKRRKIFACGGDRPTILSVSQLRSVNINGISPFTIFFWIISSADSSFTLCTGGFWNISINNCEILPNEVTCKSYFKGFTHVLSSLNSFSSLLLKIFFTKILLAY